MRQVNFILFILVSVFLIGCASPKTPIALKKNLVFSPINPKVQKTSSRSFQTRGAFIKFNPNQASNYTIQTNPTQLIQARELAYQKVLSNRLRGYGITQYYKNGNGIVFVTKFFSINTLFFRDFIRAGFCPVVNDLALGFKNNRRVIMLDKSARQGRYVDYSKDFCALTTKMTVLDANRIIFPKIMAY